MKVLNSLFKAKYGAWTMHKWIQYYIIWKTAILEPFLTLFDIALVIVLYIQVLGWISKGTN